MNTQKVSSICYFFSLYIFKSSQWWCAQSNLWILIITCQLKYWFMHLSLYVLLSDSFISSSFLHSPPFEMVLSCKRMCFIVLTSMRMNPLQILCCMFEVLFSKRFVYWKKPERHSIPNQINYIDVSKLHDTTWSEITVLQFFPLFYHQPWI